MQPTCLTNVNEARHDEVISATEDAIERLSARSQTISFYSVAKEAGIARSTLYRRDDLRKLVEDARARNASQHPKIPSKTKLLERIAELEADLEHAKWEIEEARCSDSIVLHRYAFIQLSKAA